MLSKELCNQYINEVVKPLLPNVECGGEFEFGSDMNCPQNLIVQC